MAASVLVNIGLGNGWRTENTKQLPALIIIFLSVGLRVVNVSELNENLQISLQ